MTLVSRETFYILLAFPTFPFLLRIVSFLIITIHFHHSQGTPLSKCLPSIPSAGVQVALVASKKTKQHLSSFSTYPPAPTPTQPPSAHFMLKLCQFRAVGTPLLLHMKTPG